MYVMEMYIFMNEYSRLKQQGDKTVYDNGYHFMAQYYIAFSPLKNGLKPIINIFQ